MSTLPKGQKPLIFDVSPKEIKNKKIENRNQKIRKYNFFFMFSKK